jgi:hypothetical protein
VYADPLARTNRSRRRFQSCAGVGRVTPIAVINAIRARRSPSACNTLCTAP